MPCRKVHHVQKLIIQINYVLVTFGPPKQELAADLDKLRSKYTVLKPKKQLVSASINITPKKESLKEPVKTPTKGKHVFIIESLSRL